MEKKMETTTLWGVYRGYICLRLQLTAWDRGSTCRARRFEFTP